MHHVNTIQTNIMMTITTRQVRIHNDAGPSWLQCKSEEQIFNQPYYLKNQLRHGEPWSLLPKSYHHNTLSYQREFGAWMVT